VKIIHLIILAILLVLAMRFIFVVRRVECVLSGVNLETGVCERINSFFKGSSLFFTDFENALIWEDLLGNQEYSQAYQYQAISKSLSGVVTLTLVAKMPDYRLVTSQGSFLLNQSNKLRNDRADLSLLSIEVELEEQVLKQGYLESDSHQQFFALAEALNQFGFSNSRVKWFSNQEIQIETDGLLVLLDTTKDFVYQVERLRVILDDQKTSALPNSAKILDLRFNLPVLK
jgi:hypothetical protein